MEGPVNNSNKCNNCTSDCLLEEKDPADRLSLHWHGIKYRYEDIRNNKFKMMELSEDMEDASGDELEELQIQWNTLKCCLPIEKESLKVSAKIVDTCQYAKDNLNEKDHRVMKCVEYRREHKARIDKILSIPKDQIQKEIYEAEKLFNETMIRKHKLRLKKEAASSL